MTMVAEVHLLLICCCIVLLGHHTNALNSNESKYFIDQHSNCNNVYGAVEEPDESTQWVTFLGKLGTTKDCYEACLDASNSSYRCESYTFLTRAFGEPYANHCYARFNYPLWTPIPQQYVDCGRIIWNCENDRDCSFNGKCNKTTGNCTCNPQWHGYKCGYLKLDKVNDTSGYIITNDTDNKPTSSWGGSIITSTENHETNLTKYHMFLTEFDNHCGYNSFQINSVVTHAQSTNGYDSPYERVEVIHGHFAAEPDIIRGNNGENVLYYNTYNYSSDVSECHCQDGSTNMNQCKLPPKPQFNTVMSWTTQSEGPYLEHFTEPMVIFANSPNDTDFGGVITSDARFIGMLRVNNESTGSEVYLVTASNWKDHHSYTINNKLLFPYLTNGLTEDPYLWIDCDGHYHALFHNMSPHDEIPVCGGHAFSSDGTGDWIYGGTAYDNHVSYINGSSNALTRRERYECILSA